jgi:hypothetical protein
VATKKLRKRGRGRKTATDIDHVLMSVSDVRVATAVARHMHFVEELLSFMEV